MAAFIMDAGGGSDGFQNQLIRRLRHLLPSRRTPALALHCPSVTSGIRPNLGGGRGGGGGWRRAGPAARTVLGADVGAAWHHQPAGGTPVSSWGSPIRLSPHNPSTIAAGGRSLFISRDRGNTWTTTKELGKGWTSTRARSGAALAAGCGRGGDPGRVYPLEERLRRERFGTMTGWPSQLIRGFSGGTTTACR